MKLIIFSIFLVLSKSSFAYDHSMAVGQWAVHKKNLFRADFYYFININPDYSGVLVRYFGREPLVREFSASSVIKRDGYFEVQLGPNEKTVFSAWTSDSGVGRLTGQIFMYEDDGELFNMLYYPLDKLEENHKLLDIKEISALSKAYNRGL